MLEISKKLTLFNENFSVVLKNTEPAKVIIAVPHDGLIASNFGFFSIRDKGTDGTRATHGRDKQTSMIGAHYDK